MQNMQDLQSVRPEEIIRQTLREQGRSQRWLAEQMRWSYDSMRHSFTGERDFGPERLRLAARILGIPGFVVDGWLTPESVAV